MSEDTDGRQVFPGRLAAPSGHEAPAGSGVDPASGGQRAGGLRLLAFDPGNVSGWCLYDSGTIKQGQVGDRTLEPRVRRRAAFGLLAELAPTVDALAYEHFIAIQGIAEKHADALYIQGAIEYVGACLNIPVYRYRPKPSKSRVSDDQLKELGWYPPWGMRTGGHAADATRILVCTLVDEYPQEMMK
jgi:hypothetical protein